MINIDYTYNATVTRVIDGDTLELVIDLGFRIKTTQRARVIGIDTPEIYSGTVEERAAGQIAKEATRSWCEATDFIVVATTYKTDSFGRWLVDVTTPDGGSNLTQHLLDLGYKPWVK